MIRSRREYEADLRFMLFRKAWTERESMDAWTPDARAITFMTCLEISMTAPIVGVEAFGEYVTGRERAEERKEAGARRRRGRSLKGDVIDKRDSGADAEGAASAGAGPGDALGGEESAAVAAGHVDAGAVTSEPDAIP